MLAKESWRTTFCTALSFARNPGSMKRFMINMALHLSNISKPFCSAMDTSKDHATLRNTYQTAHVKEVHMNSHTTASLVAKPTAIRSVSLRSPQEPASIATSMYETITRMRMSARLLRQKLKLNCKQDHGTRRTALLLPQHLHMLCL